MDDIQNGLIEDFGLRYLKFGHSERLGSRGWIKQQADPKKPGSKPFVGV